MGSQATPRTVHDADGGVARPAPAPVRSGPERRRHPWLTAAVAGVGGTAALGVGAGVAVRWLPRTGPSWTALLGLCLVVAGVVLLGYALRLAWVLLRRWWRLVLVPIVPVVLTVASSLMIGVVATVVPPTSLAASTPADEGLTFRAVRMTTDDGVLLAGWLVPSRNGAAVVVRHGSGSTRTAALTQAGVLGRAGYGVLLVDARGHGRSGGRGMDFGWYGDQDTTAAVDFLTGAERVAPGRVGVLGLSMGGEEAIGAAAADPRIGAVVAEGATARTAADKAGWLPGGVNGTLQRGIDAMTYGFTDLLTPAAPPRALPDAVRGAPGTSFLLVTAGDLPDERRAADAIAAAAPDRVSVWTVPGAGHTEGLRTAPRQWSSRVLGFLDAHLSPSG